MSFDELSYELKLKQNVKCLMIARIYLFIINLYQSNAYAQR